MGGGQNTRQSHKKKEVFCWRVHYSNYFKTLVYLSQDNKINRLTIQQHDLQLVK